MMADFFAGTPLWWIFAFLAFAEGARRKILNLFRAVYSKYFLKFKNISPYGASLHLKR
jgi:hypothetical protein